MMDLKALEILKECLENEKDIMKGYENLSNIDYIQEAITELEALKYNYEAQEIIIRDKTALIEAIELNNKNGELSGIKKAFDTIKTVQANTDDILKYNILDDIADLVLEEAPYLKTQLKSIIKLQRRIEELEALQAPKTCETCKHRNHLANETDPCNSCMRRMLYVGYCNDSYEPKESK